MWVHDARLCPGRAFCFVFIAPRGNFTTLKTVFQRIRMNHHRMTALLAMVLSLCGMGTVPMLSAGADDLFVHADLPNSFGDGSLTNAGYSFQDRQPLASFEDPEGTLWQVVGYISLNRLPVIQWRKREAGAEAWSLWARTGADASILPAPGSNWHGYMSVGIDTAGYAHFIYDGRGDFRYHRSAEPVHEGWTGDLVNRSANGIPGWSSGTRSTYWRFSKHPETGLMTLAIRRSGSGHALFVLDADTQTWSAFPGTRASDGRLFTDTGIFAQYVSHDAVFRGDDLYVGYTHRQSGSSSTNEDLSVIKFNAAAGRWQRLDGTNLTVPVEPREGTIIDPAKTDSMLDHRWDLMADGQGFIHGFYRKQDDGGHIQIFHFWIDEDDTVHGPAAVTDTRYTGFWQNVSGTGVELSQARSFHIGARVYVAWQEEDFGNRTVASASQYPFDEWTAPQVIDSTNLRASDPEFERWAWDTREEIWLTAMPFLPNTAAGRPVSVVRIPFADLPVPEGASATFAEWIVAFDGLEEAERLPDADPARDGIPNLLKYALGMDPAQPGHGTVGTVAQGGMPAFSQSPDGQFSFLYRKDTSLGDINYIVEWSDDLAEWREGPWTETVVDASGDIELREVAFPPGEAPAQPVFVRLSVAQ